MKRLVCSMDGTWNDDVEALPSTNVAKLTRAVLPFDDRGIRQLVRYVAGIPASQEGSMSFEEASGSEIGERIRAAYQFLSNTYEPGDEIYLFGFSRGAYEARSLASFIALFGIARKDASFSIEDAWQLYRLSERRRDFNAVAELSDACHYPVRIRCIGVWDTVEYAGTSRWSWGWLRGKRSYHDIRWHDTVDVTLHALAIDETRRAFRPAMFTLDPDIALPPHQHVEQAWFAGSHGDVGGGWPETELADVALLWMAAKIRSTTDLALDIEKLQRETRPDPLGVQHAPETGWRYALGLRFPYLRLIQDDSRVFKSRRTSKLPNGQASLNETVDESALARLGQTIREKSGGRIEEHIYQPPALQACIAAASEDET